MIKSSNNTPPKFIFLTYLNRSGSTYLASLLSKSDEVFVCPEAESIINLFLVEPDRSFNFNAPIGNQLKKLLESDYKFRNWNLSLDDLLDLCNAQSHIEAFLRILKIYQQKNKPGASIILYKAERLIDLLQDIPIGMRQQFQIKIMGIVRDCRAVYSSQKENVFPGTRQRMSNNPVKTALQWNSQVLTSLKLLKSEGMFIITFEELIKKPERILKQLVEFIGIKMYEFLTSPGDLYSRLPEEHKRIHRNITKPPEVDKTDKWRRKLSLEEVSMLQIISKKYLLLMGYKIDRHRVKVIPIFTMIAWYYLTYRCRLIYKKILFKLNIKL